MIAFIKSLKRGELHGWRVLKKERMSKCKTTIKKQCHSERSEESLVHQVGVTEILRYALDDKSHQTINNLRSASTDRLT